MPSTRLDVVAHGRVTRASHVPEPGHEGEDGAPRQCDGRIGPYVPDTPAWSACRCPPRVSPGRSRTRAQHPTYSRAGRSSINHRNGRAGQQTTWTGIRTITPRTEMGMSVGGYGMRIAPRSKVDTDLDPVFIARCELADRGSKVVANVAAAPHQVRDRAGDVVGGAAVAGALDVVDNGAARRPQRVVRPAIVERRRAAAAEPT